MAGTQNRGQEQLIRNCSYQPQRIFNGMITTGVPYIPSKIERTSMLPFGTLEKLPLELVHYIFSFLDFKTLTYLRRTSRRAIDLVENFPDFRDLMHVAPRALAALAAADLLKHHPIRTLHVALQSSRCVACNEFGAFLFLPTAERCCFDCLRTNRSLWVIPLSDAAECFSLSPSDKMHLTQMYGVPGAYWLGRRIPCDEPSIFVSVRAAKQLALHRDGSLDSIKQRLSQRRADGLLGFGQCRVYSWLLKAPLKPSENAGACSSSAADEPRDYHSGIASIQFPSLVDGKGLWCLGCLTLYEKWMVEKVNHPMAYLAFSGVDVTALIVRMMNREWSDADFLTHIEECPGIRTMRG